MRTPQYTSVIRLVICFGLVTMPRLYGQGYDNPLTMQGLNHITTQSVASRAMGGVTFALHRDASLMFTNPASLTSLGGIQLSLSGLQRAVDANQDQRYGALQAYSAFTMLTQSLTGTLSDPDTTGKSYKNWKYADSVQRPFDSILPNWNRTKTQKIPVQGTLAVPIMISGMKFIVGLGVVEYANLDWYYQNNNCFSKSVLSVLNGTISTVGLTANPYQTQWYEYYQDRSGSIYGYGGVVSFAINDRLSLGLSGMMLKGSTDDVESRIGRGRMTFFSDGMRLDKAGMISYQKNGTSDYSGTEFTASAMYTSKFIDIGFSIKPPTTITRSYSSATTKDSTLVKWNATKIDSITLRSSSAASGEDKIVLPWRGSIGFALRIRDNITLGVDYEIRATASAIYTNSYGIDSNPWLSSSVFHIGGEYRVSDWLALRAGASNNKEVFEPLSNPIRGDAVSYPVYSAGCAISFASAVLNVTYEYSEMKYIDMWSNAASINQLVTNTVSANLSYTIPWM